MKYILDDWQAEIVEEDVAAYASGERRWACYGLPTGTGKTILSVATASQIAQLVSIRTGNQPVIWTIVMKTAKFQWWSEITKSDERIPELSTSPLDVYVIDGDAGAKEAQIAAIKVLQPKWVILNYDILTGYLPDVLSVFDSRKDIVILDESDLTQNPISDRSKACRALARSHFRIVTTASLIYNRIDDIYTQLQICDPTDFSDAKFTMKGSEYFFPMPHDSRHWGTYSDFLRQFAVLNPYGSVVGIKNVPEFHRRLEQFGVHIKEKREILDLPELHVKAELIDLTPAQQQVYQMAAAGFVAWLDAQQETWWETRYNDSGRLQLKNQILAKLTYVRRATSLAPKQFVGNMLRQGMERAGLPVRWDRIEGELTDGNAKLNWTRDYISEHYPDRTSPGGVILYSQWRDALDSMQAGLRGVGQKLGMGRIDGAVNATERERVRLGVLSGNIKLVLTSDAGGRSLNLQMLNATVCNDLSWTPTEINQVSGREERRGQQNEMFTRYLIARNTVDQKKMLPLLVSKQKDQDAALYGQRGRRYSTAIDIENLDEVRGWV